MRKIGIYDDVFSMFHQIGLDQLFHMALPAYKELCVEFFSSLILNCESIDDSEEGEIIFGLGGRTHTLSIPEFNRLFDFPAQGARLPPENYDERQFGVDITGYKWYEGTDTHRGRMKALDIQNPCFRIVQRYLAYSIFGREHQASELRQEELFFLWSMVNSCSIDVGYFLARQLHKVAKLTRGAILMGGFITHIAIKLGVDFTSQNPIAPSTIDEQHCINIRLIRPKKNNIHLIYRSTKVTIKLPAPNRTSIREKANWILFTAPLQHEVASSRTPQPPPSTSQAPPEAVMHDDIDAVIEKVTNYAFEARQTDTHPPGIPQDMYTSLLQQNAHLQSKIIRLEEENARLQQKHTEDMDMKGALLYIKDAIMDMKGDIAHMKGDIGMVLDRQVHTDERIGKIEQWMEELDIGIARVDSPK